MRNQLKLILKITREDNSECDTVFDSTTQQIFVAGTAYPGELKLLSDLIQLVKETHKFTAALQNRSK